jgi:hypothetical protein
MLIAPQTTQRLQLIRYYPKSDQPHVPPTNDLHPNPRSPINQLPPPPSQVTFPPCWDGQNLDSSDHKSHVRRVPAISPQSDPRPLTANRWLSRAIGDYNGGVCPQSHPHAITQIFYEFFYDTSPYTDHKFVYAMGDVTGYGLHGDFINCWTDLTALGNDLTTCTGLQGVNAATCSLNVNGQGPGSSSNQVPEVPAIYEEDVGLNGPVAALPGNNPVTGTPPTKRSRIHGGNWV